MGKLFYLVMVLLLVGCSTVNSDSKVPVVEEWDKFPEITFVDLNDKITKKESFVAYFGWVDVCPDSANIQKNYFDVYGDKYPEWLNANSGVAIYTVNLDNEISVALRIKDFRKPMTDLYGVKYGPTLIAYKNGERVALVEWTPVTSDPKTAIPESELDAFFKSIKGD